MVVGKTASIANTWKGQSQGPPWPGAQAPRRQGREVGSGASVALLLPLAETSKGVSAE